MFSKNVLKFFFLVHSSAKDSLRRATNAVLLLFCILVKANGEKELEPPALFSYATVH